MSVENNSATILARSNNLYVLTTSFFAFSFLEIIAEYLKSDIAIWILKPFLLPILIVLYFITSKDRSSLYMSALVLNWLANLFFMSKEATFFVVASFCFICYRVLILIKVYKEIKIPTFSILLGSIPFLFIFLSLINIVFDSINGVSFYLSVIQALMMTVLGGYAVAYFVLINNESSKMFLASSLFYAVNLFLLGMKFYFFDFVFLKPLSMVFFVAGQFLFYRFLIMHENKREFINN